MEYNKRIYKNSGKLWTSEEIRAIRKYLKELVPKTHLNFINLQPLADQLERSQFSIRAQFVLYYKNDPDSFVYEDFPYMKQYFPSWKKEYYDAKNKWSW